MVRGWIAAGGSKGGCWEGPRGNEGRRGGGLQQGNHAGDAPCRGCVDQRRLALGVRGAGEAGDFLQQAVHCVEVPCPGCLHQRREVALGRGSGGSRSTGCIPING